jgi:hypothetical protein
MACPYFYPTRRLESSEWRSRIRPPLGDAYEGECHANPAEVHQPPRELMLEGCNLGYASQQCRCFPTAAEIEAIRFCVRSDTGIEVCIDYVLERSHLPCKHGPIVYDRRHKSWQGLQPGSLMERQAQAYLESYLSWKDREKPNTAPENATIKRAVAAGKD